MWEDKIGEFCKHGNKLFFKTEVFWLPVKTYKSFLSYGIQQPSNHTERAILNNASRNSWRATVPGIDPAVLWHYKASVAWACILYFLSQTSRITVAPCNSLLSIASRWRQEVPKQQDHKGNIYLVILMCKSWTQNKFILLALSWLTLCAFLKQRN